MSELPSGWERVRLGDLGHEVRGSVQPEPGTTYELYSVPTYPTGRPELLRGEEIGSTKRPVEPGDVLLCKINPRINRVWAVADPSGAGPQIASTEYLVFRTPDPGLSAYLRWYFHGPSFRRWIELSAEGATGSHTRAKSGPILEQAIPIPPAEEQERIVAAIESHLSRLDSAEAVVRTSRTRFDTLRKTVISEVLGRGTWPMVSWGDAGQTLSGRAFPSAAYSDDGIRLLRPGNLTKSGRVGWTPKATTSLPERFASESPKYVLDGRNLLMNLTAQSLADDFLGRVCLSDEDDRFLLNQRIAKLSSPVALNEYLFWVFRSASFRSFVAGLNAGSLIQHISTKQLASFVFPLPPLKEQGLLVDEIESAVEAVDRLALATDLVPRRASLLRRSILSAAFSGQLVSQDSDDGPASVLLEQIRAERAAANSTMSTQTARVS